jgi:ADP-heptose:LPS heptosyltransferase
LHSVGTPAISIGIVADAIAQSRPRLLVIELWGLGDLTFSMPMLHAAVEKYDVTIVGKSHARPLLEATFPSIRFVAYDAPWSAYLGKYFLWLWRWTELLGLIFWLRRRRFDVAVSVRNDPRDHLLMWLCGARERYGFPHKSSPFLNRPVRRSREKQHKVEDWRDLGAALGFEDMQLAEPRLNHTAYRSERVDSLLKHIEKPLVVIHPGARIAVRRWPESYFIKVVAHLREEFDFHLALITDTDGYGQALAPYCDQVLPSLTVDELVDVMGRVEFLLCNDSGPGHLAASCGRPAFVVFGPTDPDWFRPWGSIHHLAIRDICTWRPCFDYCKFSEPYCMTRLLPEMVWPEMQERLHVLIGKGVLKLEAKLCKS